MLNNIRKIADKLAVRILLVIIAFAFVGWGIKDVMQSPPHSALVTFSSSKPISEEAFLKAKNEIINILQKQSGIDISAEKSKELGINKMALDQLINDRMLSYLCDYYQLDITEETALSLIKQSPIFKNERGEFDIKIFNLFKKYYSSEEEYLLTIKEKILNNILLTIFLESFKSPAIMVTNIIDYMAEARNVNIVEMDLTIKNSPVVTPSSDTLQQFYQNNQELFKTPESRSFSYFIIPTSWLLKKINLNNDEVISFYNENKDNFAGKEFSKVKKEAKEMLTQEKLNELTFELAKNLEDDVASAGNLVEISQKYDMPIHRLSNITFDDLIANQPDFAVAADNIFELTEGELSYPIELQNKGGLLLVELKDIKPSKIEDFAVSFDKAKMLWENQQIINANLKTLNELALSYEPNKGELKNFPAKGIKITAKLTLSRHRA